MFNKEEFRDLLIKARGKRTNEEYARESGVSRPYISAYLNLKRNEAPSPEVIKRLAKVARNGVKYEDFMKAAGYIEKISNESCQFVPVCKNKIDLADELGKIISNLEEGDNLMLHDEPIDKEDREILSQFLKLGLRIVKKKK